MKTDKMKMQVCKLVVMSVHQTQLLQSKNAKPNPQLTDKKGEKKLLEQL